MVQPANSRKGSNLGSNHSAQGQWAVSKPKSSCGARYSSDNPRLQNLRSWPVAGFEAVRIYYVVEKHAIDIIRIVHGKRDVRKIPEGE
jgi:hypothetical protein